MPDLMEIIQRSHRPQPWAEGEKIPWNDPGFSQRMLREHLSQEHDWASRRAVTIQKHVDWIQREVLYTTGLDGFWTWAVDRACTPAGWQNWDTNAWAWISPPLRSTMPGKSHKRNTCAAPTIFKTFGRRNSDRISTWRCSSSASSMSSNRKMPGRFLVKPALPSGRGVSLLLEVHTFNAVKEIGSQPSSWYSTDSGLFSDRPHLCLQENFWEEDQSVATGRYFVVDGETGRVTRHASSMQAYTEAQYRNMLVECGFQDVAFYPSLTGENDPARSVLFGILAHKK